MLEIPGASCTVFHLQAHILPTEDLTGIYRLAVLLTGEPREAQALVLDVFADAGEKIHHFRNGKSCEAWLVAKVRNRALNRKWKPPEDSAPGETEAAAGNENSPGAALEMAARFCRIPEPGRSALALLYINRFTVEEIAQVLQMPLEAMAQAVDAARTRLQALETRPQAPSAEEAAS